jgi:hypothetical protein
MKAVLVLFLLATPPLHKASLQIPLSRRAVARMTPNSR